MLREERGGGYYVPALVCGCASSKIAGLGIGAEPESERERRPTLAELGLSRRRRGRASVRGYDGDRNHGDSRSRQGRDQEDDPAARAHRATIATSPWHWGDPWSDPWQRAHTRESGSTRLTHAPRRYSFQSNGDVQRAGRTGPGGDRRDLDHRGRKRVSSPPRARSSSTFASRTSGRKGISPAPSTSAAEGSSQRIEGLIPDKSRALALYCSAGSRSAFAAKMLGDMGYTMSSRSQAASPTGSETAST